MVDLTVQEGVDFAPSGALRAFSSIDVELSNMDHLRPSVGMLRMYYRLWHETIWQGVYACFGEPILMYHVIVLFNR